MTVIPINVAQVVILVLVTNLYIPVDLTKCALLKLLLVVLHVFLHLLRLLALVNLTGILIRSEPAFVTHQTMIGPLKSVMSIL